MRTRGFLGIGVIMASLCILAVLALAEQDRFTLKAPNGVAFSEFRGYETWEDVCHARVKTQDYIFTACPLR